MNRSIMQLTTVVAPEDTIDQVVRKMAQESWKVSYPGLAVVLGEENTLLGVVTDGDIRRIYTDDVPFSRAIADVMVKNPITVPSTTPPELLASEVIRKVQLDGRHSSAWIRHVLIIDDSNKLVNIVDFMDALQDQTASVKRVAVFGMGYVGVTLAVSLANIGHQVTGVDINQELIDQLNKGIAHVHEPGLDDMLAINLDRQQMSFSIDLGDAAHQVYIVAVGTPLNESGQPDLTALNQVLCSISSRLKTGDQVMLRSTVPVGTTREIVITYLEEQSNLVAGEDFYVSFAPERTIEGKAMLELKTLPQVVGGYTPRCVKRSADFWGTLTHTLVQVDSLEAAEMVKLANNTFRDLSFAFANELAFVADKFNVNAFSIINAANEGYPRNPIPFPSPGVGGYCLTKDPILFSSTHCGPRNDAVLGLASRKINEKAALYPSLLVQRYAEKINIPLSKISVLIMGIAFKGEPETTDTRGAVALDLFNELNGKLNNIYGWDAVVPQLTLKELGFAVEDELSKLIDKVNVVLILNNHQGNLRSELYRSSSNGRMIFDGWNQLDAVEVEKIQGLSYSTMGYMSLS